MFPNNQKINNLSDAFPKHPHRTLHILLAILAVAIFLGSIVLYKIQKAEVEAPVSVAMDATLENLAAIQAGARKNISEEETLRLLQQINDANRTSLKKK